MPSRPPLAIFGPPLALLGILIADQSADARILRAVERICTDGRGQPEQHTEGQGSQAQQQAVARERTHVSR